MEWMLVVVVLGIAPIKTGLLFDDLDACWAARDPIAREYADVYNDRLRWSADALDSEAHKKTADMLASRLLGNAITCIPHAAE